MFAKHCTNAFWWLVGIAHLLLPLNAHGVICIATRSNFLNTFPRQFWDIASFGFDPFLNGSSLAWAKVTNFQRSESFAFANDMNVFSNGCYHLQIITIKGGNTSFITFCISNDWRYSFDVELYSIFSSTSTKLFQKSSAGAPQCVRIFGRGIKAIREKMPPKLFKISWDDLISGS